MAVYTTCVSVDNHKGLAFWVGAGLLGGVVAAIATLAIGGAPWLTIPALVLVIAYCHWWLTDRLVCLGGERCAIGILGAIEPPENKKGLDKFDTDYSINLILAPHNFGEAPLGPPPPPPTFPGGFDPDEDYRQRMHHQIADDGIQGDLIREQDTTAVPRTLLGAKRFDFEGSFNTLAAANVVYKYQAYLHAEFEGGGVQKLLEAAEAALALATAAAVACAIPFFGWIACAILSLAAAIVSIAGIFNALNDKGHPTDVNPDLTELHSSADVLVVKGRWVYDSAHEGWNELHPITYAQRIGSYDLHVWPADLPGYWFGRLKEWRQQLKPDISPADLNKPADAAEWRAWVAFWCDKISVATSPLTRDAQARAENQWTVHPDIDGCRPAEPPAGGETGGLH